MIDIQSNVAEGRLNVGSTAGCAPCVLSSPIVINEAGATLGGHGTIIGDVFNFGTLAPGSSIGTLSVDGDVDLDSSGTFEAELTDTPSNDLLQATGDVDVDGTLDVVLDAEFQDTNPADGIPDTDANGNWIPTADFTDGPEAYDIITAEGTTPGTFHTYGFQGGDNDGSVIVQEDDPNTPENEEVREQLFKGYIEYHEDLVRITSIPDFGDGGSMNDDAFGEYLDSLTQYGLHDDDFSALMVELGYSGGSDSIDQLSPEWYNSFNEVGLGYARDGIQVARNRMFDVHNGTGGAAGMAYNVTPYGDTSVGASGGNKGGFWVDGGWSTSDVSSDDDFIEYDWDTWAIFFGFDYAVNENIVLGLMGGYQSSDVDYDDRSGAAEVDGFQFAGYLSAEMDQWFFDAIGGWGDLNIDSSRDINFGSVSMMADAKYDGDIAYFGGRVGYVFEMESGWRVAPEFAYAYSKVKQDEVVETGADLLNLIVDKQSHKSSRLSAEVKFSKSFATSSGGTVIPYLRAGVSKELEDDLRILTGSFVDAGGQYTVFGDVPRGTAGVFGAGVTSVMSNSWALFFDYSGQVGSDFTSHSLMGGVRVNF
jgi:outer membrane autotransporter protein